MARAEPVSEEITLVPGWRGILLRQVIADQKVDARGLRTRAVVERLIHVVERRMIFRYHPLLLQFQSVDFWIDALYPVGDVHRGNALQNEGILVAANEEIFLRHGIRTERITDPLRRRLHLLLQAGVLHA